MAKLEEIEGIDPVCAQRLRAAGIGSVESLLRAAATPEKRRRLGEMASIDCECILGWVNQADLMRVCGIGEEYSDILKRAGVDTVAQLAHCSPRELHARIREVNAKQCLVQRLPSRGMVAQWVKAARALPRVVS